MSLSDSATDPVLPGLDFEPDDIYVLHDLEQVRAATTLLRIQILDSLASKAMTVRELGHQLGTNSTQLYYHVGKLEQVGLVRLVHTEVQGGIQQKYFRARAHYYYLSPDLLHSDRSEEIVESIRTLAMLGWIEDVRASPSTRRSSP
jgi:predicted transcriptional regulator